jgi:citrate synthase
MPTVDTCSPYVSPSESGLGYTENFIYMMDKLSNDSYKPHPVLVRALDVLFILHAGRDLIHLSAGLVCLTAATRGC